MRGSEFFGLEFGSEFWFRVLVQSLVLSFGSEFQFIVLVQSFGSEFWFRVLVLSFGFEFWFRVWFKVWFRVFVYEICYGIGRGLVFVAANVQIFVLWAAFWTVLQGRIGQQLDMVFVETRLEKMDSIILKNWTVIGLKQCWKNGQHWEYFVARIIA
ncbi:unnamed protein product [Vicia faba]|uniref:Transmembrane protein n=1 Tax=Vicia faba TaxID=3906 RepID=A0AAV0YT92_VICFA|nr:unnamed protein product [Vicia faba]